MCPPASRPCATNTSTPTARARAASATVVTWWIVTAPAACARATASSGSPRKKEKTGTRSARQAAKVSSDVNLSLRTIKSGVYQLVVQNQSRLGFLDTFAWVPGPGWKVTAILETSAGTCIVNAGAMACNGKISPPTRCTCLPGGRMTITFRMTGPHTPPSSKQYGRFVVGTAGGYLVVKTVTLIHRHIPTALPND